MAVMSTTDATFLWETEAIRESTRRRHQDEPVPSSAPAAPPSDTGVPQDGDWVTLREAHAATGIPVETLRKWARRGSIPSRLDEEVKGTRRMIHLEDVVARAHDLGRPIAAIANAEPAARKEQNDDTAFEPPAVAVVDLSITTDDEEAPPVAVTLDQTPPAEGTMIVPIAAWDKMLMQLGNLHEAGQQLAEARERAAKAETENRFLKERLADLRSTVTSAEPAPPEESAGVDQSSSEQDAPSGPPPAGDAAADPAPTTTRKLMRSLQRWRIEVRRR
jgi:DNA-binding transcriptional MerR regulator